MKFRFFPYDALAIAAIGPHLSDLAIILIVKLTGRILLRAVPADSLSFLFVAAMTATEMAIAVWIVRLLDLEETILSARNWKRALALGIVVGITLRVTHKTEWFALRDVDMSALGLLRWFDVVIIAPLVESIFWCGAVYTALRQRHSWAFALLVSAAGFSLSHDYMWLHRAAPLQWHAGFIWGAFSGGMVTAVGFNAAYGLTGSLVAPILAHLIYNL